MQTHPRESEILELNAQGLRSYEIAKRLELGSGEVVDVIWRAGSTPVRQGITTPVPQADTDLVDKLEAQAAEVPPPKRDAKAAEVDALKLQIRGAKADLADLAELTQQLATREEMIARRDAEIDALKVRLGDLAGQLGCKASDIEEAVSDLTEALAEEAERREAAEARIAHVERGRLEAVEELLKARREIRLERERMAPCEPSWTRWMTTREAADRLGVVERTISYYVEQGRLTNGLLIERRKAQRGEASNHTKYMIRYQEREQ